MSTKLASSISIETDSDYAHFERLIAVRVASVDKEPIFTTKPEDLWGDYLKLLPDDRRQHYNCHACRKFIERFGSLARIDDAGRIRSLLWEANEAPPFFQATVANLQHQVERSRIAGVFLWPEPVWGTPQTGEWTHLAGAPARTAYVNPLHTAAQIMAEKREDYGMLCRGLAEFPVEAAVQAVRLLDANVIDRSENTLGVAQWFLALHQRLAKEDRRDRFPTWHNLVWKAVATAPPGWCHIRNTMISTLLDDIVQGLPFDTIKSRWNAKMHPLQYQRPTAPPSAGQIKAANALVEKLGSAGALQRRFAQLTDILATLWVPRAAPAAEQPQASGGFFDHLRQRPNTIQPVQLPAKELSWDKFQAEVLPTAHKIEMYFTGAIHQMLPFFGLLTAVNPDAPPILQWDGLEGLPRNPVSWYFYVSGSPAARWFAGSWDSWVQVNAVFRKPCYWQQPDKFKHQGTGIMFALEGARDLQHDTGGGFFPETLKAEYHGIRAAMEAYAQRAPVAGKEEGNANGICLDGDRTVRLRVNGQDEFVVRAGA